ncbi:hypothetical protein PZF05_001594 [Acinetobacter baumannii]|nr:hypothetical protein [Acinetobacter baumannii]
MTDLNKEREAFEEALGKHNIHNVHLCTVYDFKRNEYFPSDVCDPSEDRIVDSINLSWKMWLEKAKAQAVPQWINVEVGVPVNFGTRVKIKRKSWDEEDNLIFVESEATYDKDSDFCELSNRTYEYETWFDHELKKYLEEDEITHWAPLDKSESGAEG